MYYFIVNYYSGSGISRKIWREIELILQTRGINYKSVFTNYQNHATELVKELKEKKNITAVVAVGGDGTVNEVINGLTGTSIPLGVIPTGSGNDFCRAMGIPLRYELALERILKGELKEIDIGRVNDKYFATIVGVGFDGQVAQQTNRSKHKKLYNLTKIGSLSYIISLFKVIFMYKPSQVELHIDSYQTTQEKVWLIAIANSPCYAGGMMICPDAKNNDETFDICIVKGISRWSLLRIFPSVFKGKHILHPAVTTLKAKKVQISSKQSLVAHADGEIIGKTPFDVTIQPSSLTVL
ncbi:diacylglycerol/lipid kinase family protein [Alkalibacillus aidingensis]|uniref:diacylglycerol/lipid kinase family protein n=1 Tax=Alkalibacillus aidingensis TaxID=2747607 RepID=UPI001660C58A|nr:diacylglycerol kinase family protein [Alkalibacillus aidingensis]